MSATKTTSYICLVKSTDLSGFSEDELNKIQSDFMSDQQKLRGIVQYSSYFFELYLNMIRMRKWKVAEENRKGAQGECEDILQLLVINGFRSEQQKQDGQYVDDSHIFQSSSLVLNKHKNSNINANKPTTGENNEYFSKAGIGCTSISSEETEMATDYANSFDKITSSKSVQDSNTHQTITQGRLYNKSGGISDAAGSVTDESEIMRRSEEASLLLVHGNPNIADLSDSNRPVKLAERYLELYSNEYTDAFEELATKHISERGVIQILLTILSNAYLYCRRKANDEITRIQYDVQIDFKKKGYRSEDAVTLRKAHVAKRLKQSGITIKDTICQNFFGEELPTFLRPQLLPMGNKLSTYASSSVEIVWWMCIQDPPLCMKWTDNENTKEEFDTNLYRFYTKSGKYVDYCVWPVLLLHDGGPVLTKGIAEGK
ncbi:hypothetical protein ACJMK2_031145 [Sinanodonta woodiana]|uniref:Mitochondria-eating protein C-terminal domain-containing protein n=1 Tax=Sinanodonta woodiana TaxID=1069815 RepID=A0ABD3WYE6_SINWO